MVYSFRGRLAYICARARRPYLFLADAKILYSYAISRLPHIAAVLAYTLGLVCGFQFATFRQQLQNESRQSEQDPLYGYPPPADAYPPYSPMMLLD